MTLALVRSLPRLTLFAAGLLIGPLVGAASAVTVPSGAYPTIQSAINAVLAGSLPDGTTIDVQPGTYSEALVVSSSARSFTVRGAGGAGVTFVDAAGKGAPALTVYRATGQVAFIGLTFRRGAPPVSAGGGFVITQSSPAFTSCIFESNTASAGGGGAMFTSNATFAGTIIRNNSAGRSGGGVLIYSGSHPVFTGSDITGNVSGTSAADGVGGGVDSRDSSPTFRASRINANASKFAGGGIYHAGAFGSSYGVSTLTVSDSDVADNLSSPFGPGYNPAEGGGIHIEDNAVGALTRARILRNRANTGGGINAYRARYDVVDSIIDANQAMARSDGGVPGGFGGGVMAASSNPAPSTGPVSVVNLTGTLVRNNVGVTGGGIVVTGDVNFQATLTVTNTVVDRNQAQNQGGGILVSHGALTSNNSMIIRNSVTGAAGASGGGIDVATFSSATIIGTTIAHNTASQFGGGIFVFDGTNGLSMNTSNVYENTAGLRGGGLFMGGSPSSTSGTIQNSIIADNNGSAQINEEGCTSVNYQNNTITPKSGGTQFSGCAIGSRQTGTNSNVPRFEEFLAVPSTGTASTLAWSVARATSVSVSGVGTWTSPTNSPTGTVDVTPASTTTYSLTAVATSANGGNYGPVTAGFTQILPPTTPVGNNVDGDFDGDLKADVSIFRPATGAWYIVGATSATTWGGGGDIPVARDYDGDGKTDIAVFRPGTGVWYIWQSRTQTAITYTWGSGADIPVPADYDGDGKADIAIFRPATSTWFIWQSRTQTSITYTWGGGGDIPVARDYDGDGKADIATFRPATGVWYIWQSRTATGITYTWGSGADIPVPNDYDGDGKADIAIFRRSTGVWYIWQSRTGTTITYTWGGGGDIAVPGDYDGDGKSDVAVFRPGTSIWYIWRSGSATAITYTWGGNGDIPSLKRP